jgi:hypothetical protein
MTKLDEINKYIVSICLTICTPAIIWACISLQEVKVRQSVIETKVDMFVPFVEMTRDVEKRVSILEATQPQKKGAVTTKNSESLVNYLLPLNLEDIDNKRVAKLDEPDIIINY